MLSSIDHMLEYKTCLNKSMHVEFLSNIFSNNYGMKLEMNYREKNGKKIELTNIWRLNSMLLKKQ